MEDDPFLRPLYLDEDDELDRLDQLFKPKTKQPKQIGVGEGGGSIPLSLVAGLIKAQDVLSRLEAGLAIAEPDVAKGVRSRAALLEASGFLAHHKSRIHQRDLALREAGLTGNYIAAQSAGSLSRDLLWSNADELTESDLPEEIDFETAVAYARFWRRIGEVRTAPSLLESNWIADQLQIVGCRITDTDRLSTWLGALPSLYERPGLLQPAWILAHGLPGRQREDKLDIAAACVAILVWRSSPYNKHCALPLFSAPTNALNKLGRQGGEEFNRSFFECVTEAGLGAMRELNQLREAISRLSDINPRRDSSLYRAGSLAIREPVITAVSLAKHLKITARAGINIIDRLMKEKFLKEITGRAAWRAFAID